MAIYRQGNEFSDKPFSGDALQRDLEKIAKPEPAAKPLPKPVEPDALRDKTGLSKDAASSGGTGGISSPLKETSITDRIYHSGKYITTSDGLFAWPAIKTLKMKDSAGRAVVIEFASPP